MCTTSVRAVSDKHLQPRQSRRERLSEGGLFVEVAPQKKRFHEAAWSSAHG